MYKVTKNTRIRKLLKKRHASDSTKKLNKTYNRLKIKYLNRFSMNDSRQINRAVNMWENLIDRGCQFKYKGACNF